MTTITTAIKATTLVSALAIASCAVAGFFASEISHAGPASSAPIRQGELALDAAEAAPGGLKSAPVCDGVTDDTVALQAMLDSGYDALSSTYKPIVVTIPVTPEGCVISSWLEVHSNTRIVQDGLLRLVGFVAPTPVEQRGMYTIVDNSTNVTIEGSGTLDGNRAAYAPGMCCMGGIVSGGPEVGDYAANVSNITIRGLRIINSSMWPLSIDGATNVKIDSVTADNSVSTFQVAHNSTNVSVNNVHVSDSDDIGFAFYRGVKNASLTNSVVHNTAGSAISVFTDAPPGVAASRPSSDIAIVGNVAYEGLAGIDINGGDSASSSNVNVSGNVVHHNVIAGISVSPCTNCQVVGNLIHDDGTVAGDIPGIWIVNSQGLNVASNTIYNVGLGALPNSLSSDGYGIIVNDFIPGRSASSRLTITGNNIYDDRSTKAMKRALYGIISSPASVTANTLGATINTRDGFTYAMGSAVSNINMP
jgi:parallel beta-helix repeat protein